MSITMRECADYFTARMEGEIGSADELQEVLVMYRAFDKAGYYAEEPADEHLVSAWEYGLDQREREDACPPHGIDRPYCLSYANEVARLRDGNPAWTSDAM